MSTSEERLTIVEKDVASIRRDMIYKLDDTNSAVTIIRGVLGKQGQDIKYMLNQVRGLDIRLEGVETQMDGLALEVRALREQQSQQGEDIQLLKADVDSVKGLVGEQGKKLDQVLQLLTALVNKLE